MFLIHFGKELLPGAISRYFDGFFSWIESHNAPFGKMPPSPDSPARRIRIITRSGRVVRPPLRYDPEPDGTIEDDYSDAASDEDWGSVEESQNSETETTEVSSSSYESMSDTSESEDEEEEEDEDEEEGYMSEPFEDVIDWETLTADATDGSYSSSEDELHEQDG